MESSIPVNIALDLARHNRPSEQLNEADLCNTLQGVLAGTFTTMGIRQLLGYLSEIDNSDIPPAVAKDLQSLYTDGPLLYVDRDEFLVYKACPKTASQLWSILQEPLKLFSQESRPGLNMREYERRTFSRIIRLRSIPPIIALQVLTSLSRYLNIERLLSEFVRGGQSGTSIPKSLRDPDLDYLWTFSIKYYYLNRGKPEVHHGQVAGVFHEKDSGLFICRGSALVSLSFDTKINFNAPWTLVVLSCHEKMYENVDKLNNGVSAFFWAIHHEITHTRASLEGVSDEIASLAVPSDDFLFDNTLHQTLLFEDESYTNTRMYFWALQSLRTVNECIASIISTWQDYDKFSLMPAHSRLDTDAQINSYIWKINRQIQKLIELKSTNNKRQEDIRSLRDGVFNASSVLEARTTIAQGKNVQLLTYISLVFLPASFVASVFSMGIIPPTIDTRIFAVTFSLICGATYTTILLVASGAVSRVAKKVKRRQGRAGADEAVAGSSSVWRSKSKTAQDEV